jgi:FXSXX-COOH protein
MKTSASFAAAKQNRVPLTELDVRGGEAAKRLARVVPAPADRSVRVSSFNSSL